MSTFEQTPPQTGPGSEAWEVFWDAADEGRAYPSDGYSPRAVAAGVLALESVISTEQN